MSDDPRRETIARALVAQMGKIIDGKAGSLSTGPYELLADAALAALDALPEDSQPERPSIQELIERSSLGTPEAKAARERVPLDVAQRIVERSKELQRERDAARRSGSGTP